MNELDLHGYKVHDAWKEFSKYIQQCYLDEIKTTTIITGHGKMSEEILAWVYANQYCKTAKRSRNTGAFIVDIRKNKSNKKLDVKAPTVDLSPLLKKFNSH